MEGVGVGAGAGTSLGASVAVKDSASASKLLKSTVLPKSSKDSPASVDGAGRFGKMWHITVPGLIPTFVTLLLLNIGSLLSNGFEQFYLFNNGLVQSKIQVLDLYVYRIGISQNNYPMSTALGMTKTLVSIALLMTANLISRKLRNQSIF